MSKMSAGEKARQLYFEEGYACSEAVWLAMAQDSPEEQRAWGCQLAGGFGGGVACGSLCGALAGAVMGLGLSLGRQPGQPRPGQLRQVTQAMCAAFKQEFGALDCRDIKPQGDDYRERCAQFVEFCADTAVRLLAECEAAN